MIAKKNQSENQHQIDIILDQDRYEGLIEICKEYKAKQDKEITPREFILMLIDSAIGK